MDYHYRTDRSHVSSYEDYPENQNLQGSYPPVNAGAYGWDNYSEYESRNERVSHGNSYQEPCNYHYHGDGSYVDGSYDGSSYVDCSYGSGMYDGNSYCNGSYDGGYRYRADTASSHVHSACNSAYSR
eukprot:10396198-Ditylum_brightwellii.AAC.1